MKSKGRPRVRPVNLKDGFYIEVCDIGVKKGMKIRCESQEAMEFAANQYNSFKKVVILGEFKDGIPIPVVSGT